MTFDATANPSHARSDANPALTAALAITAIAAATLAGAWFFQLVLDILPCPLCLEQRYAYYLAIPLGALVASPRPGARRAVCCWLALPSALAALANAGLGAYHAGRRMGVLAGTDRMHRPGRQSRQRRQSAGASGDRKGDPLRRSAVAVSRPVAGRLQRADLAADGRDRGLGHCRTQRRSESVESAAGSPLRHR